MFAGLGYDVHRFKKGRPLFLGGVKIEHSKGLDGHSDADVLIHALMDSLLGAAGLPDIGRLFPNTDRSLKNISSLLLLEKVFKELKKRKYKVLNVDITVIAEEPRITPHVEAMKKNISGILRIKPERTGIKATTNESMGFIGRKEGIAAMAVCSLAKK